MSVITEVELLLALVRTTANRLWLLDLVGLRRIARDQFGSYDPPQIADFGWEAGSPRSNSITTVLAGWGLQFVWYRYSLHRGDLSTSDTESKPLELLYEFRQLRLYGGRDELSADSFADMLDDD